MAKGGGKGLNTAKHIIIIIFGVARKGALVAGARLRRTSRRHATVVPPAPRLRYSPVLRGGRLAFGHNPNTAKQKLNTAKHNPNTAKHIPNTAKRS